MSWTNPNVDRIELYLSTLTNERKYYNYSIYYIEKGRSGREYMQHMFMVGKPLIEENCGYTGGVNSNVDFWLARLQLLLEHAEHVGGVSLSNKYAISIAKEYGRLPSRRDAIENLFNSWFTDKPGFNKAPVEEQPPQEEVDMKLIETVIRINGTDAADMDDEQKIAVLKKANAKLIGMKKDFDDLGNKPKKLGTEIQQLETDIDALVKHIDGE